MRAKITAYNNPSTSNDCSDFSINTYWGDGYKNTYYLCGDLGRPTFVDTIETTVDDTGQETRTKNTTIERYTLSTIVGSPFLSVLKTLDKHDVITIEDIDTTEVWTIKNIDIEDDGTLLDVNQRVLLSYEIDAITSNSNNNYIVQDEKQAFWDNDDDGIKDLDGNAYFDAVDSFSSWQLYYESDGVTPAVAGDITLLVYAVKNGTQSILGRFNGAFGDSFDDSTKWQSTQSIWDYFTASETVGHTNKVVFDKKTFASDNGYTSDELEDRAIQVRFDLAIDASALESTTLDLVYSSFGAFHRTALQEVTGEYGITTINKDFEKISISNQNDVRQQLPSGTPVLVTSFVSVPSDLWANKYQIAVAPAAENGYRNSFVTNGGYVGSSYRGQDLGDGFSFSLDAAFPVGQTHNILSFVTGDSPYLLELRYRFDKNAAFAELGDVVNGTAQVLLDGVLVTAVAGIDSTASLFFGQADITLPDTDKHTVRFEVETTGLDLLFTEFEVQIKPLF